MPGFRKVVVINKATELAVLDYVEPTLRTRQLAVQSGLSRYII